MTDAEAQDRARALGLTALRDGAWCLLVRYGVELVARGSSWPEAFARLESPEPVRGSKQELTQGELFG